MVVQVEVNKVRESSPKQEVKRSRSYATGARFLVGRSTLRGRVYRDLFALWYKRAYFLQLPWKNGCPLAHVSLCIHILAAAWCVCVCVSPSSIQHLYIILLLPSFYFMPKK